MNRSFRIRIDLARVLNFDVFCLLSLLLLL